MAKKTSWTDVRLRRLFDRYRQLYWPRKLGGYEVKSSNLEAEGAVGLCECAKQLLSVDTDAIDSDREVRSTLLHEMAHAAAGARSKGHDSLFFEQLEYLLSCGAPISLGLPETGNRIISIDSVPARLVLCRRALCRPCRKRDQEVERLTKNLKVLDRDESYLAQQFQDSAALDGLKWRSAVPAIGVQCGLLDINFKSIPYFAAVLPRLRPAHRRGLKFRPEDLALRKLMSSERGVAL